MVSTTENRLEYSDGYFEYGGGLSEQWNIMMTDMGVTWSVV